MERAGLFFMATIFLVATGVIMGSIDNASIKACHPGTGDVMGPSNSANAKFLGFEIPGTGFLAWLAGFGGNLLGNFACFIIYAWWLMALVYIPLIVIWIYGLVGIIGGG